MPEELVLRMRQEDRLKPNCDYSWIFKYNELTITCHEVYKPILEQYLAEANITVTRWFTYR